MGKHESRPCWSISWKNDGSPVKSTTVIESHVRVICTDGKQLRPQWVNTETLHFSVSADVLVKIYEDVSRLIAFTRFWFSEIKFPEKTVAIDMLQCLCSIDDGTEWPVALFD